MSQTERDMLTRCINKPIGAKLRAWRKQRGKSLRDVANSFQGEFSPAWLCQVENGSIASARVESIFRLARHYGVPMAEVAGVIWKALRTAEAQSYELPDEPVLDVATLANLIEQNGTIR